MNHHELIQLRLQNQQISGSQFDNADELVQWFGAIQAQDFAQAKWAIGLRMMHSNDTVIQKEFDNGTFLRTHLLRPTWHFVHANDIKFQEPGSER